MNRSLIILISLLGAHAGHSAAVSLPNELDFVEGNTAAIVPFRPDRVGGTNPPSVLFYYSMRYQQVYNASHFAALDTNGEFITHVAFRIDADWGQSSDGLLRDVQLNLSTTQRVPDDLSSTFSENTGSDDTIVYGPAELVLGGSFAANTRPQPFRVTFALERPFLYRASAGNLLFDVRVFTYSNSLSAAPFDAVNTIGDSVSSVSATNVSSQFGTTNTTGLVTLFYTTPILQLDVLLTNQNLFFRWWDQPKGFVLEGKTNLTSAIWQLVSTPSVYNDGYREVTLPLDTSTLGRFFRLEWTPAPGSSPSGSSGVRTRSQTAKEKEP